MTASLQHKNAALWSFSDCLQNFLKVELFLEKVIMLICHYLEAGVSEEWDIVPPCWCAHVDEWVFFENELFRKHGT